MSQISYERLGPVYLPAPINVNHPLNRGLQNWWLTVPGMNGGIKWLDLKNKYKGTLTSMGNSSNGWRSTARQGAFGEVLFDGTAGYVDIGTKFVNANLTLSAWVKPNWTFNAAGLKTVFGNMNTTGLSASNGWGLCYNGTSPSWQFVIVGGGNNWTAATATYTSDSNYGRGNWQHLVVTVTGATASIYINGVLKGSASTGSGSLLPGTFNLGIGFSPAASGSFFTGSIDDVRYWTRTLNTNEIVATYENSVRNYPALLNRRENKLFVLSVPTTQTYNETGSGGALGNGSATIQETITISGASGALGGTAATIQVADNPTASGGALGGTTAVYGETFSLFTASGGTVANGTAPIQQIIGGALGDGSATLLLNHNHVASGGAILNGSADLNSFNFTGSGGEIIGGSASIYSIWQTQPSGGTLGNGSALVTVDLIGVGGGIVSGKPIVNSSTHFAVDAFLGAAVLGGAATNTIIDFEFPSGGSLGGATATNSLVSQNIASGGSLGGGTAPGIRIIPTSGGSLGSGSATISCVYKAIGSSGAIINGTGTIQATLNIIAASGAKGDGTAAPSFSFIPSGGSIANGTSIPVFVGTVLPLGGALAEGRAALRYDEPTSGGAVCLGGFFSFLISETGSGGARLDGTAEISTSKVYVHVTCSHGQLCGYAQDDQFCADELLVQAYGSKLVAASRRDQRAAALSKNTPYGSTALVPAITLCRQKLRLRPQDQPPPKIVSVPPAPNQTAL